MYYQIVLYQVFVPVIVHFSLVYYTLDGITIIGAVIAWLWLSDDNDNDNGNSCKYKQYDNNGISIWT